MRAAGCCVFSLVLLVFGLLGVFSGECLSAEYYLSPTGDDGNPGTPESPWRTLGKASREAGPGDTVVLLPGEYEGTLRPVNSGRLGEPVVFRASERRKARLTGGSGNAHALIVRGRSHIRLEGLHIRHRSAGGQWVLVEDSSYVDIVDCLVDFDGVSTASVPLRVQHTEHVRILDNDIGNVRNDMLWIGHSRHLLFEGNAVSRGGHAPMVFRGMTSHRVDPTAYIGTSRYMVIRDNVFHAGWGRALAAASDRDILFEGNIITNSFNSGRSAGSTTQFHLDRGIWRFNRFYRNWGLPVSFSPFGGRVVHDFRAYNNVFDDNLAHGLSVSGASPAMRNNVFMNNAFYRNDSYGSFRQAFIGSGLEPARFMNNLISTGVSGEAAKVVWGGSLLGAEEAGSAEPGIFRDNIDAAPGFAGPGTYNHMILADSQMRDAGRFFTRASESGAGRVLPVEDTLYFYDGFGIRGEEGDLISVGGAGRTARVVEARHDSGELLLDRDMSWDAGAPVSLPWSGDAPDIGVHEYGGGRPSVHIELKPGGSGGGIVYRAGEKVRMRAMLNGIDEPAEFEWHLGDGSVYRAPAVSHGYAESNDYPIRLRVTDAEGRRYMATAYVVVDGEGRPRHLHNVVSPGEPLVHSTFCAEDKDWWFLWQTYRPGSTSWRRELDESTGEGYLNVMAAGDGTGRMPCRAHPAIWDIDRYPRIVLRYRVKPGTPVGLYLSAFRGPGGSREICAARAPGAPRAGAGIRVEDERELKDDGRWHELEIDARKIREVHPGVDVLEGIYFEARDSRRVESGHAYHLDEVVIGP